ncbi:unnamed protein product [Kuraishia capsulata CBS 1993]|uniref:Major facilitator superfamily (MFS) profile domain-containing protein n=1 Tax=Kuraishia capsulata CBS 1993 TaxID=1382522 RepID=W6MTN4_9ASCO|nr:uncharacterized protein KUCA_T00005822001 [Kuraishia capsulata CBS 1993]CDK29828.1 unnamed protein product [Kuraishia capsulata CBS 1993]
MSDISADGDVKDKAADPEVVAEPKLFEESNAGDGTHREEHYLHGARLMLCLFSLYICTFLIALDQTIVITIMQNVGNHFNALNKVAWITTAFSFSMAVFMQIWGSVSIAIGRKVSLFLAVGLFELGSLLCGVSNTINMLIGGRVIAGFGGGGIQSLVMVIIAEVVPIERRPIAMAGLGVTFGLAMVLGPLIGGAFTTNATWRWCFYINLPIGGLAAAVVFFVFHPPKPKGKILPKLLAIDWFGLFLMVVGFTLFLLALSFGGNEFPWRSAAVILCFVLGGLFIGLFSLWNFKYSKNPLIPAEIVRVRAIDLACLGLFAVFAYFMALVIYAALYFQTLRGYSALIAGVSLLPTIIPMVIFSIGTGISTAKFRYIKPFTVFGGALGPLGCGLWCLLGVHSGLSLRIGCQIIFGIAVGTMMQPFIIHVQMAAPKTAGSTIIASTLMNFARNLGAAVGSDLAQLVYTSTLSSKIRDLEGSAEYLSLGLDSYPLSQLTGDTSKIHTLPEPLKEMVLQVFMAAFKNVFYLSIGFAAIAFFCALCMPNVRLPKKSKGIDDSETEKDTKEKCDTAASETSERDDGDGGDGGDGQRHEAD